MRRALIVAAVAASSLFVLPGVAAAQDPEETVPPAFAPPDVTEVTDVPSAEAFIEEYADDNAGRFLRENRRRVRVIDANAACLEHPAVADRFGCVFTLRVLTIQRTRGWDGWGHKAHSSYSKRGKHRPRFRIRAYGCLGLARIQGGVGVEPQVTVPLVECRRISRDDMVAPEPTV